MRLLIITQKIDKDDDILGFFHRWVEKFSEKFQFINIICLQEGIYSLPANARVFSLGKENGRNRVRSFYRFYKYIGQLKSGYDAIFVHMNPIYVILGGMFWKLFGKKIYLWHNHKNGNIITRLAILLSNAVFYTSPHSFSAKFGKSKIMPVGIDIEKFKSPGTREAGANLKIKNSVLYLGRFSSVKNVDILIEAVNLLDKQGLNFILNIVGEPGRGEESYFDKIKELSGGLESKGKVKFWGKVANYKTPEIYNQNEIFVNLTQIGSFDKTTLEAMSCQGMVLVSNPVFEGIFPKELQELLMFKERDAEDLAKKIIYLMNLPKEEKEKIGRELREIVVRRHSLDELVKKLCTNFGI